jgi:Zn-dependent protease with chaperone function
MRGALYDGTSSRRIEATAEVAADGTVLVLVDGRRACGALLTQVEISPRIGDTPRALRFPGGELFETRDNDAVDEALAHLAVAPWARLLHGFESRWLHALVALVVVGASAWWTVTRGIPLLAERVARALPATVEESLGESGIGLLDRTVFESTRMETATQERLRGRFAEIVPTGSSRYELLFRRSAAIGANAFALPDGAIIVTDELVETAEHDDEIVAVLAHEIGHVVHRHSLRQALQNSTLALLALSITNDAGSVSSVVAGLPALLVQTKFSRDFEREADAYASALLRQKNISPEHLANLLGRMETRVGDEGSALDFLSTHPSLEERAARLRERR